MEAGCKVSTYDHQGNSSLHTACLYGATRFVDHFLKTDPSAVTSINVLNKQKEVFFILFFFSFFSKKKINKKKKKKKKKSLVWVLQQRLDP